MQLHKALNVLLLVVELVFINHISTITSHRECGVWNKNTNSVLPWTANIYQKGGKEGNYTCICSGTVVSRRVILTAAHCFYDDLAQKIKDANFVLSVGQKYRRFNSSDDIHTQIREISHDKIMIPEKYSGVANMHANNIAIIKLNQDEKLNINDFVKRACVFWDNNFSESQLQEKVLSLKLAFWDKSSKEALKILEPTYLHSDVCKNLLPHDFQDYLTFDKLCVKLNDTNFTPSIGCGLYVLNESKNLWYLIGIASEVSSVNSAAYITFVALQPHLNWISNSAFLHVN